MTSATLAGRCIAVTRPAAQADSLCHAIEARGGCAIRFPVLAIGPADDPATLDAVADRLDHIDLAFFVSPNAAQHALPVLLSRGPLPSSLMVATVGKGSERALAELGVANVIAPASGFDSEAVLALPAFQSDAVRGRRVAIFRGDGGRDLLGETLRERGATVEYVTCYRRYRPVLDPDILLAPARASRLDAIIVTSSEGVDNLAAMVGENGMMLLREVPLFASHPRIAARAGKVGFGRVFESAPGDAGLLDALEAHF